jgi:hypothetical protein
VTPFDPTVPELAEYTGAYMSEEIDPVYRIAPQDGNLSLTRLNTSPVLLGRPCGMFLLEILVRYSSRATRTRNISGFILNSGRIQSFRFTRKTN